MLQFSYIILSVIMVYLILVPFFKYLGNQKLDSKTHKRWIYTVIGSLVLWFIYLLILSGSNFLRVTDLPPRIPLFLFLPFFLFLIQFYIRHKNNPIMQNIPLKYTTAIQSFRVLVEIILLYSFKENIVPEAATFEGLNFDILMGISAPFIAYFGFIKHSISKRLLVAWNILGILMVLFVGIIIGSAFYAPNEFISVDTDLTTDFVVLPYLLLPAFLAPTAIFLHLVSLIQLRRFER